MTGTVRTQEEALYHALHYLVILSPHPHWGVFFRPYCKFRQIR